VKASVILVFLVNISQLSDFLDLKKKLFRINNIKLYKLIVKKTNYANKILLNIKNKKIKLNNIHYKFNVFPKKY
jgi:hypothetical protein